METILNYAQGNPNKGNSVKEELEEPKNFDFDTIKPKTLDYTPLEGSVKEIILREEFKNWFEQKSKYNDNMRKEYTLILGQCTEVLKKKIQLGKYWESDIKKQPISILKPIK